MSRFATWEFVGSVCRQTSNGHLFLSDEMAMKYRLADFVADQLTTWQRVDDLFGWVSTERNPWHVINNDIPPS